MNPKRIHRLRLNRAYLTMPERFDHPAGQLQMFATIISEMAKGMQKYQRKK